MDNQPNPFNTSVPTFSMDANNRTATNTVFGEQQMAVRKTDIAAQFHYGFPAAAAIPDVANGGSIAIVDSILTLSTGNDVAGHAKLSNKKALRYLVGHECYIFFTAAFTQGKAGSAQRAGMFNSINGYFVGYEGADFCCTRRKGGVDYKEIIDVSKVYSGRTFDPTKGNVYKISFGYLGVAPVSFEIMNPDGGLLLLHKMKCSNNATITHITNTNLQPRLEVENSGNNTNMVAESGGFSAGVVNGGGTDPAARRFTYSLANIIIVPMTHYVITFRSRDTFNSLTNYIQSLLTLITASSDLNKNSIWSFRKGMTITNTPTWTDVRTLDSTMEYSTNATFTSGTGQELFSFSLGRVINLFEDIERQKIEIFPQEYITLLITTPTGTTGTFDLSLRRKELF